MNPAITLCADDFGHSDGTSAVIAELAADGAVNAISCMTSTSAWRASARRLRSLAGVCQIGLHLTLTDEQPLTHMPSYAPGGTMPTANQLYRQALFREAPLGEIQAEIVAQFETFVQILGRLPDFVDGHQHVVHFAQLRDAVLEETAYRAPKAWLRSCEDSPLALARRPFFGKALASAWQSRGFASRARTFGLATNTSFAGHYDFGPSFERVFPSFFSMAGSHHLIMVHPGDADRLDDPIGQARVREANFLRNLRSRTGVELGEAWRILAASGYRLAGRLPLPPMERRPGLIRSLAGKSDTPAGGGGVTTTTTTLMAPLGTVRPH